MISVTTVYKDQCLKKRKFIAKGGGVLTPVHTPGDIDFSFSMFLEFPFRGRGGLWKMVNDFLFFRHWTLYTVPYYSLLHQRSRVYNRSSLSVCNPRVHNQAGCSCTQWWWFWVEVKLKDSAPRLTFTHSNTEFWLLGAFSHFLLGPKPLKDYGLLWYAEGSSMLRRFHLLDFSICSSIWRGSSGTCLR